MTPRHRRTVVAAAAIAGLSLLVTRIHSAAEPVRLLVVPFKSDEAALGRNVSNVLNLQIWQTLRRAPTPNPRRLDFGPGEVDWSDEPLSQWTHDSAEAAAADADAQLVLWGRAWTLGSSVIAQSYLSIRTGTDEQRSRLRVWSVTIRTGGQAYTVTCDAPALRYEFSPIQLRPELVKTYSGTPAGLPMYADASEQHPIGFAGDQFSALEQHSAEWAQIDARGTRGWVRLPQLSKSRTEVVDFTSGLIRVLRRDWEGAESSLGQVVQNTNAPTALRVDAHLLRAAAIDARGGDSRDEIAQAERLNPGARRVATYSIMSRLAALSRLRETDPNRRPVLDDVGKLVDRSAPLFPKDSDWLASVKNVLGRIRAAGPGLPPG